MENQTARAQLYLDGELYCDFLVQIHDCNWSDFFQNVFMAGIVLGAVTFFLVVATVFYRLHFKHAKFLQRGLINGNDSLLLSLALHCALLVLYASWILGNWSEGGFAGRWFLAFFTFVAPVVGIVNRTVGMIRGLSDDLFDQDLVEQRTVVISSKNMERLHWFGLAIFALVCLTLSLLTGYYHDVGDYELEQVFFKVLFNMTGVMTLFLCILSFMVGYSFNDIMRSRESVMTSLMGNNTAVTKYQVETKRMIFITNVAVGTFWLYSILCFVMGNVWHIFTIQMLAYTCFFLLSSAAVIATLIDP